MKDLPNAMAPLIAVQELAQKLGVSDWTIRNWEKTGVIPSEIHEGRNIKFDEARVRDVLQKRARAQQKAVP